MNLKESQILVGSKEDALEAIKDQDITILIGIGVIIEMIIVMVVLMAIGTDIMTTEMAKKVTGMTDMIVEIETTEI